MSGIFDTGGLQEAYARRREPESLRRLAEAYWAIVVPLALLAFLCGAGYGVWQILTPPPEDEAPPPAAFVGFNREELGAVVKALEERQRRFFEGVQE
jgi:hypothetical protein